MTLQEPGLLPGHSSPSTKALRCARVAAKCSRQVKSPCHQSPKNSPMMSSHLNHPPRLSHLPHLSRLLHSHPLGPARHRIPPRRPCHQPPRPQPPPPTRCRKTNSGTEGRHGMKTSGEYFRYLLFPGTSNSGQRSL